MNSDHQPIEFFYGPSNQKPTTILNDDYTTSRKSTERASNINALSLINWRVFRGMDINASLTNWSDTFLVAVDQHILTGKPRNVNEYPWIDHELLKST